MRFSFFKQLDLILHNYGDISVLWHKMRLKYNNKDKFISEDRITSIFSSGENPGTRIVWHFAIFSAPHGLAFNALFYLEVAIPINIGFRNFKS